MTVLGRWLRGFVAFWWDFVVGDDWRLAAGIVVALAGTAAVSTTGLPSWWVLPVAVLGLLGLSLRRGLRDARGG